MFRTNSVFTPGPMAKSPRKNTSSSLSTRLFHRSMRASFIAWTEGNGRLQYLIMLTCPKWVSLVTKTRFIVVPSLCFYMAAPLAFKVSRHHGASDFRITSGYVLELVGRALDSEEPSEESSHRISVITRRRALLNAVTKSMSNL